MAHPSYRAIAHHLGLSDHMQVRALRDKGMPINTIVAAEAWYRANVRSPSPLPTEGKPTEPTDDGIDPNNAGSAKLFHEARRMKADADLRELKVMQERGELVYRDVARRWIEKRFSLITARLTALPDEISGELPSNVRTSIGKRIEDCIGRLLVELSEPPVLDEREAA